MDRLEGKSADKDMLVALLTDLVAQLPPDSEEKEQLQSQVDELNKKLTALFGQLSQHESNLESAFMLAKGHEGAMAKLFPWVPKTLERLENLGPPPAEPELVEKLKAEIEVCTMFIREKEKDIKALIFLSFLTNFAGIEVRVQQSGTCVCSLRGKWPVIDREV